jgi:hypothetical protein
LTQPPNLTVVRRSQTVNNDRSPRDAGGNRGAGRDAQGSALRTFLADWRNALPIAGLGVLALTGLYYFLRPRREDPDTRERERRAYLNRVGRIVEGQVTDVVDGSAAQSPQFDDSRPAAAGPAPVSESAKPSAQSRAKKHEALVANRHGNAVASVNGLPKLLYYTYSISGVTYETAQDITGLEEQLHLDRVAAGQTASVKYDPSNPSNSILLADDWSGLH